VARRLSARDDGTAVVRLAVIGLCAVCTAAVALAVSDRGDDATRRPAAAPADPPDAPVRGCRDRIREAFTEVNGVRRSYRFRVRPRHDTRIGPAAFTGMKDAGRADWDYYVREDQWLKSIALVRRGARVTLEVPREQRGWMRLEYGGRHAVTLDACDDRLTPWSGGFTVDYDRAPREGRCAELIVWVDGEDAPRRKRLFAPPAGACS
jgi:hypothetical protein